MLLSTSRQSRVASNTLCSPRMLRSAKALVGIHPLSSLGLDSSSVQGEMSCSDTTALTRYLLFRLLLLSILMDIDTITLLLSRFPSQMSLRSSAQAIFSPELFVLTFSHGGGAYDLSLQVLVRPQNSAYHARIYS